MKGEPRWFSSNQFLIESKKWIEAINRKENLSILFFPKSDRARRLEQFLYSQEYLKTVHFRHKVVFQMIDLSVIDDYQDLLETITRSLNSSPIGRNYTFDQWIKYLKSEQIYLVVVIAEAEKLLTKYGNIIFTHLSNLIQKYDQLITVMNLFEFNITHPDISPLMPANTRLVENIFYYPLYNPDDTLALVRYLADRWSIKISKKQENQMLTDCGGHLWLISEAVRQLTVGPKWSFDSDGMQFRLSAISNSLTQSEKNVFIKALSTVQTKMEFKEKLNLDYLIKMKAMRDKTHISIKFLERYIKVTENKPDQLQLVNNKITSNQTPIDLIFSPKEHRVLKYFIQKENDIVTRGEIAEKIWPTNTNSNYSDWAIDQIITRLRKKLNQLNLPPEILVSVRGKGYIFKQ